MDAFTMVILACISGEPACTAARVSDVAFKTAETCEARIDEIATNMTKAFGERPEFKGLQVTYDVSCMDKAQLWQILRIAETIT